jgi:hypothetical protein
MGNGRGFVQYEIFGNWSWEIDTIYIFYTSYIPISLVVNDHYDFACLCICSFVHYLLSQYNHTRQSIPVSESESS